MSGVANGNFLEKLQVEAEESSFSTETKGHEINTSILKLEWTAERARKCEAIKQRVSDKSYLVNSVNVARAMLNLGSE